MRHYNSFFFPYKTEKIIFSKSDIHWFALSILLIVSNFFLAYVEDKDKFSFGYSMLNIFAITFRRTLKDGAQTFTMLIYIILYLAISMFLIRLINSGSINYARGGLNVYTISGVISG